jgi:hypothetical protein
VKAVVLHPVVDARTNVQSKPNREMARVVLSTMAIPLAVGALTAVENRREKRVKAVVLHPVVDARTNVQSKPNREMARVVLSTMAIPLAVGRLCANKNNLEKRAKAVVLHPVVYAQTDVMLKPRHVMGAVAQLHMHTPLAVGQTAVRRRRNESNLNLALHRLGARAQAHVM